MTATLPPAASAAPSSLPGLTTDRAPRPRTFLMCPPEFFAVEYAINAWMDPSVGVDAAVALRQWENLRATYEALGHTVHVLDPQPGLRDMVYAANGAFSVGGIAYGARFHHPERAAEATHHAGWYAANGWRRHHEPSYTNEGEGDFAYVPGAGVVLAGTGFRTDPRAHGEAQDVLGVPVLGLRLVDPRFYHLDTALFVLDDHTICYFPGAFSARSQRALRRLFPDALLADESDALAFGLNAVSDGRHVVLPAQATSLAGRIAERGFTPIGVDLSELRKGGGSVKCCTAELRS